MKRRSFLMGIGAAMAIPFAAAAAVANAAPKRRLLTMRASDIDPKATGRHATSMILDDPYNVAYRLADAQSRAMALEFDKHMMDMIPEGAIINGANMQIDWTPKR